MPSYTITAISIEHYADALAQFECLLGRLTHEESQRVTHAELEAMVQAEGGELLRRLIQGRLDQRSEEERIREHVVGEDGVPRTHRRAGCPWLLETRFGEVIVTRLGYGGRGLDSLFPLDAQLNLPPDKYSHGLREVLVQAVVRGSFDEAVDHLSRAGGGQLAKRQTEDRSVAVLGMRNGTCKSPFRPALGDNLFVPRPSCGRSGAPHSGAPQRPQMTRRRVGCALHIASAAPGPKVLAPLRRYARAYAYRGLPAFASLSLAGSE